MSVRFGKILIRIIVLVLVAALIGLLFLFSLKPAAQQTIKSFPSGKFEKLNTFVNNGGKVLINEDDKSQLYITSQGKNAGIVIRDKIKGTEWQSFATPAYYGEKELNEIKLTAISTMLSITYTEFITNIDESGKETVTENNGVTYAGSSGTETTYEKTKDGVKLLFDFEDQEIQVTVYITLKNGSIEVKIPFEEIRENGKCMLISAELFPSFEAAKPNEDGYILLPDGMGSIFKFTDKTKGLTSKNYAVYSESELDIEKIKKDSDMGIYNASMPVFGLKNGNKAFVAYAVDGENECEIKFAPAGYRVNLYRTNFIIRFRKRYSYKMAGNNDTICATDKNVIKNNFVFRYDFLQDNQANYSGMANSYRNYLKNNNKLKQAIKENADTAISLDFLLGIQERQMLSSGFLTMTHLNDVKNVYKKLEKNNIKGVQTILYGWQKDGYGENPSHENISDNVGGKSELNNLSSFAQKSGYSLYLADNYINAKDKVNGFSPRNAAVYDITQEIVTSNDKKEFLINPQYSYKLFKNAINSSLKDIKINGLAFEGLGSRVYCDYNTARLTESSKTIDTWVNILKGSNSVFGGAAAEGVNSYVLPYANRLFNIPSSNSENFKFDTPVPFIPMIIHGSIYYSMSPGNLSYDITETKLNWVEYGTMPDFLLTYKNSNELKFTTLNSLFSSDINYWTDYAISLYKEFSDRLSGLQDKNIIYHEAITEKLKMIEFSNGTKVYINYGNENASYNNIKIKARDYTVVTDKGDVK